MYFSLIILIESHCEMAAFVLWTLFKDWKNQTLFEKNKNVESFVFNYKLLLHIIGKLFEKKKLF